MYHFSISFHYITAVTFISSLSPSSPLDRFRIYFCTLVEVIWKPYWHTHAVSRLIQSTARSSHTHLGIRWKRVQSRLTTFPFIQFRGLIKIVFNRPNDLLTMSYFNLRLCPAPHIANIYENDSIRIERNWTLWGESNMGVVHNIFILMCLTHDKLEYELKEVSLQEVH